VRDNRQSEEYGNSIPADVGSRAPTLSTRGGSADEGCAGKLQRSDLLVALSVMSYQMLVRPLN
jgi:hypothetical protein